MGKRIILRTRFTQNSNVMNVNASDRRWSGGTYDYFYYLRDGESVAAGDIAIVQVGQELKFVVVESIVGRSDKATKAALLVFDLDKLRESSARFAQGENLRQEIIYRATELREEQILRKMAASDAQLAALLNDYDEIMNG